MTTASINQTLLSTKKGEERSPVSIPNVGYEQMSIEWDLIHDLLGGTRTMRDAAQKWLPKEPAESSDAYRVRLNRSILYNGLEDTISKLKNRPFTHPVKVIDIPQEIQYLENDVDGNGKPLDTFIMEVLENLIKYGIAHVFVDHSTLDDAPEDAELTIEDEKRLGARVYLVNVSPANLIGWQTAKTAKATEVTQIRIVETAIEPSGDYGDIEVKYINVYTKEKWETHVQDGDNENKYTLEDSGDFTFGRVPLVTIYANRTGFMTAKPPLMSLAWLNLVHWQSYSDQRHILRFSRFGLIFGKGLPEEMIKKQSLEVGPTKAYLTAEEHGDMKYVEHSGKSIETGQKDIEDIEQKMRVLGNQPLMKDLPNTATAERLDEGRTVSLLQSWVKSLERGIGHALQMACEWRNITPKETMAVQIYSDFEAVVLGGSDKELLLKMKQDGCITTVRLLKEEQRRGVFSEDMDPEEEAQAALEEDNDNLKDLMPDDEIDEETIDEESDEE